MINRIVPLTKLTKTVTVKGIEFTITTLLDATACTLVDSPKGGFQLNLTYTGAESLHAHLAKVLEKINALAEIHTGWQETIAILEEQGFDIVTP